MSRPRRRARRPPDPTVRHEISSQPRHGDFRPGRLCRCGKSGWPVKADARAVLREMRRRGADAADRMMVYTCEDDDTHFHVGHKLYKGPNLNDPALRFIDNPYRRFG